MLFFPKYSHWGFGRAWACAVSTIPSPVVYKRILNLSGWAHGCYSLHIQSLRVRSGLGLCSISIMPSLVVYKGYSTGQNWASQVLFIPYTIIEGQVRPKPVLNLDHAFIGCVQRIQYLSC